MLGRSKECHDEKCANNGSVSLIEKGKDELTESVSSSMDRAKELLVGKESSGANMVALGVEWESWKEFMAARKAELKGLRTKVGAK